MNRRAFLLTTAASAFLPHLATAMPVQTFSPALWSDVKATDDVVILNFRAGWSITCQLKQELIANAIIENPEYAKIQFIDVDWDTFGQSQMTQRMKVKRRSSLLVMKKGREIARLVNDPYAHKIRALLDTALAA